MWSFFFLFFFFSFFFDVGVYNTLRFNSLLINRLIALVSPGSTFNKTNLRSSNFSGANLQQASFFGANMDSANLEGADLRGANLLGAILPNDTDYSDSIFGRVQNKGLHLFCLLPTVVNFRKNQYFAYIGSYLSLAKRNAF